jgi:hypothetical protein
MDSTLSKDSNEITFAIFGSTEHKIWILQDWTEIWFKVSKSKFVWTRDRHVFYSDWLIPFRVDHDLKSLDLKWSGRIRSICTASVKWSVRAVWFRSDGRRWKGGSAHSEVRVSGYLRRGSGQMVDAGEVLVVSWGEGEVDEERRDEAVQMTGMARSIASWRGRTVRLEAARASVAFS